MTFVYIEASFQTGSDRSLKDILISELADIEFDSFMDSEEGFLAYVREDLFDEKLFNDLVSHREVDKKFTLTRIEPQNWNALWEAQFDPIEIENKVYIRAPFHEKPKGFIYDLVIEPKMSFGTGHHATTRMMCAAMLEIELTGQNICDMGCGTGILGILAKKAGAEKVVGIDIEDWAVENSIENAERNDVEMEVVLGGAEKLESRLFEGVLANINRNILIADFDKYKASLEVGGWILLSGFLETDVKAIINKGEELGFTLEKTYFEDHWRCLRMRRIA
ncbi:MAG: 50S ribosomal protein L11 methyltransferase [Bacteroidia bacterium]